MPKGLTTKKAEALREKFGPNQISVESRHSKIELFLSQFKSPIVLILLVSSVITLFLGLYDKSSSELIDTVMIFVIVFLSAVFGFIQDNKAENTIEALKLNTNPSVDVFRDGAWQSIPATLLVPGDYVRLKIGDIVPADCLIENTQSASLMEAVLTGESKDVAKENGEKIYAGTTVSQGLAEASVEKIGLSTKMGKIADELTTINGDEQPFDLEISGLTKKITKFVLGILVVVFVLNYRNFGIENAFLVAVSLAIAAVPEGLPALVTLTLGIGAYDMSKQDVLLRRMSSIESIGKVSHIFVDKTGTLTKNEMELVDADKVSTEILKIGALLTEATKVSKDNNPVIEGSPIDRALYMAAEERGLDVEKLKSDYIVVAVSPFDNKKKFSECTYKMDGETFTLYKGAPEVILEMCTIDNKEKNRLLDDIKVNSERGNYLIGIARGNKDELRWLSLLIFEDPLKEGISEAIDKCEKAGIRVSMLTGDIHTTALNVARKIHLKTTGYISGEDLGNLDDKKLLEKLNGGVNVFSRVLPEHKLKVLRLSGEDEVVAMTGDGVNDSLALKQAEVGISMGRYGTEAAKQASDIVLMDDNFASIVAAVKEGRRIRENIKKFINYLFVSNMAEILVLLLIPIFYVSKELILLPVQILWINLLTDGIPALALGADPANPNIMESPPPGKNEPLIDKKLGVTILVIGIKKSLMLLGIFFINLHFFGFAVARTALFTSFVFYEFVRIVVIRRQESLTFFSNKLLVLSLLVSVLLQLVLIYSPLGGFFGTVGLGLYPMLIIIAGTLLGYFLALALVSVMVKMETPRFERLLDPMKIT